MRRSVVAVESLRVDSTDIERVLLDLYGSIAEEALPRATARTLLRVSRTALSRWTRAAAKLSGVKTKLIRGRSSNRPKGPFKRILTVNTATIPVAIMGPKESPPRQTRNGIRVAGRHYPKGFIAKAKRGRLKLTAYQRKGRARIPTQELRIAVEPHVRAGMSAVQHTVSERWPKEFAHEADREIMKIHRRIAAKYRKATRAALRHL